MAKRLFPVLAGLFVLAGCKPPAVLKTEVLVPQQVATAVNRKYHYHKEQWVLSCPKARENFSCYQTYGVLPDAPGDAPIAVGLHHDYGSGSLFGVIEGCDERINCVYRGLILFDLAPLGTSANVVTAKLKAEVELYKLSDKTKWPETQDCIAKIGVLLGPRGGFDLPAEYFAEDSSAGLSQGVDVSLVVRDWAKGTRPNHGFILVGPKESVDNNDDDQCVAKLNSLRLEVQINVAGA